ncbi:hypothetical protein QH639_18080 [Lysinibacillus sp. 1 U-2021]|uniref:hypothetical protein n=1 Tax=Lysinibacillus sp. 1 U-2021 TaxID=3039426 RepID=UPI0024805F54|nr:hypothetical protein [Lysinibacillus sp. 1 U-2021]WGT37728.1 hypothetical protein QH639_18080 [Lysinibacillus sp. 1 U-2021]
MFKWIGEFSHRRELREIQREKEIKQAECVHEWTYLGRFYIDVYTGVDVDIVKQYRIRCKKCDKERNFDLESEALNYC